MKKLTVLAAFLAATAAWADDSQWSVNGNSYSSGLQTITAPSGSDALRLSCGAYLDFCDSDASAYIYRSSADVLTTPSSFASTGLVNSGASLFRSSMANDWGTIDGDVGIDDGLQWVSTSIGAVLKSKLTPTGGADIAFKLTATGDMSGSDSVLLVEDNNGDDLMQMLGDGSLKVLSGSQVIADTHYSYNTYALSLLGNVTSSGSVYGLKLGNLNALTTDGDRIVGFFSDNRTTERLAVMYDGTIYNPQTAATFTLKSNFTPTGGEDKVFQLATTSSFGTWDKILEVYNNTTAVMTVYGGGSTNFSGALYTPSLVAEASAATMTLLGQDTDAGDSIGLKVGNTNELTTDGSRIAAFYDDQVSDEKLAVHHDGVLIWETGDSSGSPGNATINAPSGKSAVALGASAAVITNSTVGANSLIFVTPLDTDATCVTYKAVASAGSFTVTCGAATTAIWKFQWLVVNQ